MYGRIELVRSLAQVAAIKELTDACRDVRCLPLDETLDNHTNREAIRRISVFDSCKPAEARSPKRDEAEYSVDESFRSAPERQATPRTDARRLAHSHTAVCRRYR